MTRAFMADRRAYNQLLAGLAVLWADRSWVSSLARTHSVFMVTQADPPRVGARRARPWGADLSALAPTGERELDRLVDALNTTAGRLAQERQQATTVERLAAVGRPPAGLAHEIRNAIAAIG